MTLRCKPGDMAVVTRCSVPENLWIIGRIVTVVRLSEKEITKGRAMWLMDKPIVGPGAFDYEAIADDVLTPIRDPGDDADDQMLRPLPILEVDHA